MNFDPAVNRETGTSGQDITLTCERVEFGGDATPTRSRWMTNNYITRCQSWSQQLKFELEFEAVRTSSQQRAWALRTPQLSSPAKWERSAAIDRGIWGQYVAVGSVYNSPLTHNPFENKVWEVYFSKEECSFVIIIHFRLYMYRYSCITAIQQYVLFPTDC